MGRYVEGQDRTQSVLFPERLDDWIHEDSTVRVIDVFVDELDLRKLGFERADPAATGRPGYSPTTTLLKIYVYGYLNRVQSSRRLETEAQRNFELIWLTGRLAPDFKTIADFRRDNGEAIRKVCKEFVLLYRRLKLFTDGIVAIDGSKFKAVNNRDKNFTDRKLQARIEQLEDSIKRYLVELDRADRDTAAVLPGRVAHLKDKIAKVKQQMQALEAIGEQMKACEDGQISLTDPDARSMATSVLRAHPASHRDGREAAGGRRLKCPNRLSRNLHPSHHRIEGQRIACTKLVNASPNFAEWPRFPAQLRS